MRHPFLISDAGGDAPAANNDNEECCGKCEPFCYIEMQETVDAVIAEEALEAEEQKVLVDNFGEMLFALVENQQRLTDLLALYAEATING